MVWQPTRSAHRGQRAPAAAGQKGHVLHFALSCTRDGLLDLVARVLGVFQCLLKLTHPCLGLVTKGCQWILVVVVLVAVLFLVAVLLLVPGVATPFALFAFVAFRVIGCFPLKRQRRFAASRIVCRPGS